MKCLFYFHINTQLYLRDTQKNYVLLSQPGEDPGFCIRGPKFVEGSGVLKLTSSQNYRSLYGRNFESFLAYLSRRQTACIPEKNGVEYILSRVENKNILLNWVYTQLCWWRWFEKFLSWGRPQNLRRELSRAPYSVGGGGDSTEDHYHQKQR